MIQALTLSHISYTYPGASASALENVSATFVPGWTGIVGNNGCGKSTLARIAAGLLHPDAGALSMRLTSALCEQDAGVAPAALFDFACDFAPEATALRRVLRIEDDMLWRFDELSCGEQKKIQVAAALWAQPDVLVIDEPTNHVDAVCRDEILQALKRYRGIGLLISHDRALLDSLVAQCLYFEGGSAVMRPGSYSAACGQAQLEMQSRAHQRETAKAHVQKLAHEQEKRRQLADNSASRRSARYRQA